MSGGEPLAKTHTARAGRQAVERGGAGHPGLGFIAGPASATRPVPSLVGHEVAQTVGVEGVNLFLGRCAVSCQVSDGPAPHAHEVLLAESELLGGETPHVLQVLCPGRRRRGDLYPRADCVCRPLGVASALSLLALPGARLGLALAVGMR